MEYVVLEDLKSYGKLTHLPGLLVNNGEENQKNWTETERAEKKRIYEELERKAEEIGNQFNQELQQKEIDEFQEIKQKLSPLTSA